MSFHFTIFTVLLPLLVKSVKSLIFCGSLDLIYTYFLLPLLCTVCNFLFNVK